MLELDGQGWHAAHGGLWYILRKDKRADHRSRVWRVRSSRKSQRRHHREVYNGDIGFVAGLDQEEDELVAEFDARSVRYPFGELDELALCCATTIHKSQGSEYPGVVIPVSTQHCMMLKRNLIYTGITRGKALGGQKRALAMTVKGRQDTRRWSKLKDRLTR